MKSPNEQGWAFPPDFSTSDNPTRMTSDEADIRQSLIILLSTRPGERVYRPEYGTDLHLYQFEQIDLTVETNLKNSIQKAVLLFEPRVSLDRIEISQESIHEGSILIVLYYTIRVSNKQQYLNFSLPLESTR